MHGRVLQLVSISIVTLSAGCALFEKRPTAQPAPAREPVVRYDPPQVVAAPPAAEAESDPELDHIAQWAAQAARRDDIASRVSRPPMFGESSGPTPMERAELQNVRRPAVSDLLLGGGAPTDARLIGMAETGAEPRPAPDIPAAQIDRQPDSDPPAIVAVRARGLSEPTPAPTAPPAPPMVNAPQTASSTSLSVQELARMTGEADDRGASYQEQLDRRVLHVLAGDYEQARKPLTLVSAEQQTMARQFLDALIAIRESHGGEPERQAREVLDRVEGLRAALAPLAEIAINRIEICRSVRGFGQFERIEPPIFISGRVNELITYCELADFASRKTTQGEFESRFGLTTTLLSESGDVILEVKDDEITDRCATQRRDCFIPKLLRLPATLSPGKYVVKSTIVDKIQGKVAEKRVEIRLVART